MDAVTALGFRIVRRGSPEDERRYYSCERIMGGRVVSTSPAQEREFIMWSLLDRVLKDNADLKDSLKKEEVVPTNGRT